MVPAPPEDPELRLESLLELELLSALSLGPGITSPCSSSGPNPARLRSSRLRPPVPSLQHQLRSHQHQAGPSPLAMVNRSENGRCQGGGSVPIVTAWTVYTVQPVSC